MRPVRPFATTLLLAGWVAWIAWVGACGTQRTRPPSWPITKVSGRPQATLPIRDPLQGADLTVQMTLEGPQGRRATLWMTLDSGAGLTTVPSGAARELGLPEFTTQTLLARGGPLTVPVAVAPRVFLGALTVEQMPVGLLTLPERFREEGVLGDPVLTRVPWEVSWNRGTVTLNPAPWPTGGDVRAWPLARLDGLDVINVRINGFPTRMLFDTGATVSTFPKDLAGKMGLTPGWTLAREMFYMGAGRIVRPPTFIADLEIGASKLEGQLFDAVDTGQHAVLGLTALTAFDMQVFPGKQILLRPRERDLRATAAARVGRWPWMPSCRAVGCVRARVEGTGKEARVSFEFEKPLPGHVRLLLGCADSAVPDWVIPWRLRSDDVPARHHVIVEVRGDIAPSFYCRAPNIDAMLSAPDGRRCRELAVLDVAPFDGNGRSATDAPMSIVP